MPTRNKKYKYVVEKEMEWIDEDVRIINEKLNNENPGDTSRSTIELHLRRIWAENERARLYMFMREFKQKCENQKEPKIIERCDLGKGRKRIWVEFRCNGLIFEKNMEDIDFLLNFNAESCGYGELWRCWTERPTDEQREAVKWDDD